MLLSKAGRRLSTAGKEVFCDKSIHCPGRETEGIDREPRGAGKMAAMEPTRAPESIQQNGKRDVGEESGRHTWGGEGRGMEREPAREAVGYEPSL